MARSVMTGTVSTVRDDPLLGWDLTDLDTWARGLDESGLVLVGMWSVGHRIPLSKVSTWRWQLDQRSLCTSHSETAPRLAAATASSMIVHGVGELWLSEEDLGAALTSVSTSIQLGEWGLGLSDDLTGREVRELTAPLAALVELSRAYAASSAPLVIAARLALSWTAPPCALVRVAEHLAART